MTSKWDEHTDAERDGGTCPDCGDTFPTPTPVLERNTA